MCAVVTLFPNWFRDHAKGGYARTCGVAKVLRNETLQSIMGGYLAIGLPFKEENCDVLVGVDIAWDDSIAWFIVGMFFSDNPLLVC